ncbi:hypothetical protein Gorai_002162, partial [Gossypium raimondii]|nr:hypothetical protein [Gossypium raimondii]
MLNWILCWSLITLTLATILLLASQILNHRRNKKRAVGFFHPYTNDGGGGERVLWCAVKAIQEQNPDLDSVIFSGDNDASSQSLMSRATDRFGVHLLYPPKVVHLNRRKWIEETTYPHFTMIGQSLGSVYLSWEALNKFTPLYYFDTSGYAFTYPIARLFGCKVICYTHYPTISLDMVSRVRQRSSMYNNDAVIAKSIAAYNVLTWVSAIFLASYLVIWILTLSFRGSTWLSRCKIIYYTVFSVMYGMVGSCAHLVMVN